MPSEASWEERSLSPKRVLRGWKKLRKWAIQRVQDGQAVAHVCRVLAVSRSFYYKWHTRWRDAGKAWAALEDRSSAPHTVHSKRETCRDEVRETRARFPTWGARKIRAFLCEGCTVSHQTVHEILVEENLVTPGKKKRRVWRAWARKHGNSLWQSDFKQLTSDPSGPWLITFIDDASRFVLACKIVPSTPTTKDVLGILRAAIRQWGTPRQILTDRGSQYYANHGESEFTKELRELSIMHIRAGVRKPTTTGKVERWHRTFGNEFVSQCPNPTDQPKQLPRFLETYNTLRPHQGIDYEIPLVRYLGSLIREESLLGTVNEVA